MGLDMYLFTNSKLCCRAANDGEWGVENGVAIYWRKANAIHNWFDNHIQNGVDNCAIYEIGIDELEELKGACKKVLENPGLASDVLPTCRGFFFGSQEYDDDYMDELKKTVRAINAILKNVEEYEYKPFQNIDITRVAYREKGETENWNVKFYYHAWW